MEVLTPRTLAEAVDLRAEHRGALPIQGGTDVMVAFNFDRARPKVAQTTAAAAARSIMVRRFMRGSPK